MAEPVIGTLYSTTCSIDGYPTVVGNQTCFNDPTGSGSRYPSYGVPEAFATSNITASLTGLTTEVHGTATAFGSGPEIPGSMHSGFNSAAAQFSSTDYLATGGPVRSGILKATIDNFGTGGAESGDSAGSGLYVSLLASSDRSFVAPNIGCGGTYLINGCTNVQSALIYYDTPRRVSSAIRHTLFRDLQW